MISSMMDLNRVATLTRNEDRVTSDASLRNTPIPVSKDTIVISSLAYQLAAQATQNTDTGMSIINQRLYGGQTTVPVLTEGRGASSPVQFLTLNDRKLLGEMYDFSLQQGAALEHVDAIAMGLGRYRQADNGRAMHSFNTGSFDLEGHMLIVNFSEKDATTAQRIRNSDAINSTKIDHGFLDYALNPGIGALSNPFELDFLEQMVNKFSDQGNEVTQLDARFSTFSPPRIEQKVRYTVSKEVILKPVVADYISGDGAGHWRTPELAAAEGKNRFTLNQPSQMTALIHRVLDQIRESDRETIMLLHWFKPIA
jgi:hypothetical protein